MGLHFISPKKNALVYLVKILTGSLMAWFGLRALGIPDPYWAMISVIIVTEPDVSVARANFKSRLINTISGSVIAFLALSMFGGHFWSILLAMTLAVLVAMLWENYPSNWRLGPITVVILMAVAPNGSGASQELHLALLRVVEVLGGSVIALMQSVVYAWALRRWASP
ncbi:MAG: FUSC family protein [Burkholderiales bacterium]|nr:FUSC family protein [Burkholderiales bacterium]